jgi:hypothetical protein
MGKYLSDNFPYQNGLKQEHVLPPLVLTIFLEYVIRKVQEQQVGLKLNGTYQLLVYADVNLLGDNIDAIKKNTETLIDARKDVGLELNAEILKYMLLPCHQNTWQNHYIKVADIFFESVCLLVCCLKT